MPKAIRQLINRGYWNPEAAAEAPTPASDGVAEPAPEPAAEAPAEPTVETPAVEEPETPDISNDLADLFDDEESVDEVGEPEVTEPEAATETPATEPEPSTEEPETPAPEVETPEAVEVEEPEAAAEPDVPETPQEQPDAQPDLEAMQAAQNEQRADLVKTLESELYQLSEDDANAMIAEPETVLPRIAAQLHVNVLEAAVQGILSQLPQLVKVVNTQAAAEDTRENAFFQQWPKLAAHKPAVARLAATYRQMNPQIPEAQMRHELGLQAMMLLKIPLEDAGQEAPPPAEETPAIPPAPAPAAAAQPQSPAAPQVDNPFVELAEELLNDDM